MMIRTRTTYRLTLLLCTSRIFIRGGVSQGHDNMSHATVKSRETPTATRPINASTGWASSAFVDRERKEAIRQLREASAS